ncbi:MAG: FeoB small GTPase domain-containing protein, partial [Candidatus Ranarchaeia archaeon]
MIGEKNSPKNIEDKKTSKVQSGLQKKSITVALAGNANVGKSTIFNQLTGHNQIIGNWPGKTVERAEGSLYFQGWKIKIIDLPGIYSLSTYSLEEEISREYIAHNKPDIVINVIDSTALERNLFFTFQLIELEAPLLIALNQVDLAKKKGIFIDHKQLQEILGVPVVPVVATKGLGIHRLMREAIKFVSNRTFSHHTITYGKECENFIRQLEEKVGALDIGYSPRWTAIKLLEEDTKISELIEKRDADLVSLSRKFAEELEQIHGEPACTVIASERYSVANRLSIKVQTIKKPDRPALSERLDNLLLHPILGYPVMAVILLSAFLSIFMVGDF